MGCACGFPVVVVPECQCVCWGSNSTQSAASAPPVNTPALRLSQLQCLWVCRVERTGSVAEQQQVSPVANGQLACTLYLSSQETLTVKSSFRGGVWSLTCLTRNWRKKVLPGNTKHIARWRKRSHKRILAMTLHGPTWWLNSLLAKQMTIPSASTIHCYLC